MGSAITIIVCAMLLQEYESQVAALGRRLREEQKGKAAAAEVSFAQAASMPAVMPSYDHRLCHHPKVCLCQICDYSYGASTLIRCHLPLYCCLDCNLTN